MKSLKYLILTWFMMPFLSCEKDKADIPEPPTVPATEEPTTEEPTVETLPPADPAGSGSNPGNSYDGYSLVWSDEFDGTELDLTKWSFETGTGVNGDFGTGQLDRATDRKENVSIKNGVHNANGGVLEITTRKEVYEDRGYTSGRINTQGKAEFGPGHRIEARVWAKDVHYKGQGFAFWMMPAEKPENLPYIMWPQGGEIDIMEYVGAIPKYNLGTVHYAWFWENNEYKD